MSIQDVHNRIKKRFSYLKKWAKRKSITCFRIYERDLPNYPFILDWYQGDAVVWLYDRIKDETKHQKEIFKQEVVDSICHSLDIPNSKLHLKRRGRQKGLNSQYEKMAQANRCKLVMESGLKFELNLTDYLDTGLFLDHRNTRLLCKNLAKGKRFLNLFGYTGAFTCYAAAGGALSTTTVDLNPSYSQWAQRNLRLNKLDRKGSHRFIVDNCLSFIKLEAGKQHYDLIVCDPPTFSNSKKMKSSFSVNRDYIDLIKSCVTLLSSEGILIFSTNSRSFKLNPAELSNKLKITDITKQTVPEDFKKTAIHQCFRIEVF